MTYAITNTHTSTQPPVVGWVLDGVKVATYPTAEEAEKAIRIMKRNPRYSWNGCELRVVEVKEGKR